VSAQPQHHCHLGLYIQFFSGGATGERDDPPSDRLHPGVDITMPRHTQLGYSSVS